MQKLQFQHLMDEKNWQKSVDWECVSFFWRFLNETKFEDHFIVVKKMSHYLIKNQLQRNTRWDYATPFPKKPNHPKINCSVAQILLLNLKYCQILPFKH